MCVYHLHIHVPCISEVISPLKTASIGNNLCVCTCIRNSLRIKAVSAAILRVFRRRAVNHVLAWKCLLDCSEFALDSTTVSMQDLSARAPVAACSVLGANLSGGGPHGICLDTHSIICIFRDESSLLIEVIRVSVRNLLTTAAGTIHISAPRVEGHRID